MPYLSVNNGTVPVVKPLSFGNRSSAYSYMFMYPLVRLLVVDWYEFSESLRPLPNLSRRDYPKSSHTVGEITGFVGSTSYWYTVWDGSTDPHLKTSTSNHN